MPKGSKMKITGWYRIVVHKAYLSLAQGHKIFI